MILSEKLEHGMEYENGQENIEKLRRIGGQILAASRDELYLGMRFLDVALSSFVYQMDSEVHPFGTDGGAIYFHPRELGGPGKPDSCEPWVSAYGVPLSVPPYGQADFIRGNRAGSGVFSVGFKL